MDNNRSENKGITRRKVILGGSGLLAASAGLSFAGGPGVDNPQKLFFGMLAHETNTFSPLVSDMKAFRTSMFIGAGELPEEYLANENVAWGSFASLYYAKQKAAEYNWEPVQGFITSGPPGGLVPREVYEELRGRLLADIEAAMPVDVVALMLHGAMVAEGYDNAEADLFKHIREVVGKDAVVGAVFDAHAHLSPAMIKYSDFLIASKEYPHTDIPQRCEELIDLLYAASRGRVKPVSSYYDPQMIDMYHTPREPMRGYVDKMMRLEQENDDVLSISMFQSFPWGDTPVMGSKILVITDNNPAKGDRIARELGEELYALRGKVSEKWLPMDEALDQAMAVDGGPVVVADAADNPGGGAPCDSTFILQALVDRGISNAVFGRINDEETLSRVLAAGEGATVKVRMGGKRSRLSGKPVEQAVVVKKILRDGEVGVNGEEGVDMDAAWVSFRGIDVVIDSGGGQVLTPEEFARFGIPLNERKLIVVKSSQHFYAGFSPIAKEVIYADTPAVLAAEFTVLPYKQISRPLWPFDEKSQ